MKLKRSDVFDKWFRGLRDQRAVSKVADRLSRVEDGNFGDHKSVGDGVSELRISYGPGYRIYYTIRGEVVVFLLVGGDKTSQDEDIKRAKAMAREVL